MIELKADLLEFTSREYQGNTFADVVVRYDNRIVKMRADAKKVGGSISSLINSPVILSVSIVPGFKDIQAQIVVSEVREA